MTHTMSLFLLWVKILTVDRRDVLTNTEIEHEAFWAFPHFCLRKCMAGTKPGRPKSPNIEIKVVTDGTLQ